MTAHLAESIPAFGSSTFFQWYLDAALSDRGGEAASGDGTLFGRELQDKRRTMYLNDGRVGWYVERGRGGVYWSEAESHGPSPLELVRRASRSYPELFKPALGRLKHIDGEAFSRLVGRLPEGWMTRPARKFATALVSYSHQQLKELQ